MISNCIFTWGFTRNASFGYNSVVLWIDFTRGKADWWTPIYQNINMNKLYFYVRIHKPSTCLQTLQIVVNWFQIVFLREDSQVKPYRYSELFGCELISNCIFTWGFTSWIVLRRTKSKLWIDFKLYFYVRIHKWWDTFVTILLVVNWFQIVFLREDSQERTWQLTDA